MVGKEIKEVRLIFSVKDVNKCMQILFHILNDLYVLPLNLKHSFLDQLISAAGCVVVDLVDLLKFFVSFPSSSPVIGLV